MNAAQATTAAPAQDEVDRLIEQFDPESNFRRLGGLPALMLLNALQRP